MSWLSNIFRKSPPWKPWQPAEAGELFLRILRELKEQETTNKERFNQIMSAISDFAAAVNSQNSAGGITPEDQALLDAIQARSQVVADKLDALDALTPPAAPANP